VQLGGLRRGVQAEIARRLGVDRATITRDLAAIVPGQCPGLTCPLCGSDVPPVLPESGAAPASVAHSPPPKWGVRGPGKGPGLPSPGQIRRIIWADLGRWADEAGCT
jgi:hypothetical protein